MPGFVFGGDPGLGPSQLRPTVSHREPGPSPHTLSSIQKRNGILRVDEKGVRRGTRDGECREVGVPLNELNAEVGGPPWDPSWVNWTD